MPRLKHKTMATSFCRSLGVRPRGLCPAVAVRQTKQCVRTACTVASPRDLPQLQLVRTQLPIWEQLRMEEDLLRADERNWCILNQPPVNFTPSIIMGISGKPDVLLHKDNVLADGIPVIRRFSGGGTVFVDHSTCFVTFIMNQQAVPTVQPWPRQIMSWSERVYKGVFPDTAQFTVREHDYCLGNLKVGGNAQSIVRGRWLHHTSFLYDFNPDKLASYLKLPDRMPDYRQNRPHMDFLCTLSTLFPSQQAFFDAVVGGLESHFTLLELSHTQLVNAHAEVAERNSDKRMRFVDLT